MIGALATDRDVSDDPGLDDLRGRAPEATGALSSEAFVRACRDGWHGAPPAAPAAALAPTLEDAASPIAATHLWCPICREPKDARHKPVAPMSRQWRRGMHGEHLVCVGCGTTIATCYAPEET